MADEMTPVITKEEYVLEKFWGDPADGKLYERITITDGEIVSVETFDSPKE